MWSARRWPRSTNSTRYRLCCLSNRPICALPSRAGRRMMKRKTDPHRKIGEAVARYLRPNGWKVLVTGPCFIRKLPGKHKYEFVLEIMALKKDGDSEQVTQQQRGKP